MFVGDKCSKSSQSTSKTLQDATQLVSTFHDVRHGFKENILHVKTVLDSLFSECSSTRLLSKFSIKSFLITLVTLPKLKENLAYNSTALLDSVEMVKDLAIDINKKVLTAARRSTEIFVFL